MAFNHGRLQRVVDEMAVKQLPDGMWELDHTRAPEFFAIINPYIKKSAYISDRNDPEDAVQDIREHIWKALQRYGPRYQNKPFRYLLKLKVNNVLTNNYKKKKSQKSRLNFMCESLDSLLQRDVDDYGNLQHMPCARSPSILPMDVCSLDESLSARQRAAIDNLVIEEQSQMPQKLTTEELMLYVKKLNIDEKQDIFIELWAHVTGTPKKQIINTISPLFAMRFKADKKDKVTKNVSDPKYNDQLDTEKTKVRLIFGTNEKENQMPQVDETYIDIGDAEVGQEYFTPFGKKIQIVGVKGKQIEVLLLATEDTIKVARDYKVKPVDAVEEQPEEVEEQEDAVEEEVGEDTPEEPKDETTEEAEEEADDEEEDDDEEEEPPKKTMRVTYDDAPQDKKVKKAKPQEAKVGKKTRKGTAKSLVIDMLKEKECTRDELAEAIIAKDLTQNTSVEKVKNYVSVMLSNLKRENKNLEVLRRGVYKIRT